MIANLRAEIHSPYNMIPQKKSTWGLAWIAIGLYFLTAGASLPLFLLKQWIPLDWILLFVILEVNFSTYFLVKFLFKKKEQPWIFKYRNQNPISYPLLMIVGLALVLGVVIPLFNWVPVPYPIINFYEETRWGTGLPSFMILIFISPIFDELIFRGIIQEQLSKKYSPAVAIVVASFFYGLAQLNPWYFIINFFLGLFLGWVYYRSHSVKPGMIVHVVINAELFLFNLLFGSDKALELFTNGLFNQLRFRIAVPLVSLVILAVMLWWLHRIYKDDQWIDWDLYR